MAERRTSTLGLVKAARALASDSALGSAAIAKEVVKIMKDNCIAQKESSGCCEP